MMRATCALLVLCFLGACEPAELPAPAIVSVTPERIAEGGPSVLTIEVDAVLPVSVDYGSGTADLSPLTLFIAGEETEVAFSPREGKFVTAAPAGLARGAYDVEVALADGRQAVRPQAFSVVAQAELRPEDTVLLGGLTGFKFDPIDEQVADVPFKVTLRALGPSASNFQGTGELSANKGQQMPVTTDAFSGGVVQQQFTVGKPGKVVLMFKDALGNMGVSNPFRVRPK
ncbi:MAG TPA: hypothetical protein VF815_33945 [Myxococcaceae bacterium]|jgi:hypothetical protein